MAYKSLYAAPAPAPKAATPAPVVAKKATSGYKPLYPDTPKPVAKPAPAAAKPAEPVYDPNAFQIFKPAIPKMEGSTPATIDASQNTFNTTKTVAKKVADVTTKVVKRGANMVKENFTHPIESAKTAKTAITNKSADLNKAIFGAGDYIANKIDSMTSVPAGSKIINNSQTANSSPSMVIPPAVKPDTSTADYFDKQKKEITGNQAQHDIASGVGLMTDLLTYAATDGAAGAAVKGAEVLPTVAKVTSKFPTLTRMLADAASFNAADKAIQGKDYNPAISTGLAAVFPLGGKIIEKLRGAGEVDATIKKIIEQGASGRPLTEQEMAHLSNTVPEVAKVMKADEAAPLFSKFMEDLHATKSADNLAKVVDEHATTIDHLRANGETEVADALDHAVVKAADEQRGVLGLKPQEAVRSEDTAKRWLQWDKTTSEAVRAQAKGTGKTVERTFKDELFTLTGEQDAKLREIFDALGETHRYRTVKSFDDMSSIAKELGADPNKMYKILSGKHILNSDELVAVKNEIVTAREKLKELETTLAATKSDAERNAINKQIDEHEAQIMAGVKRIGLSNTEAGRAIVANRIMGQNTLEPVFWYTRAEREMRRFGYTPEKINELLPTIRKEIDKLIEAGNPDALAVYLAGLKTSTTAEKVIAVLKAGLLTSPTTHAANILGNTGMLAMENTSQSIAAVADRLIGTVTGKRTTFAPNIIHSVPDLPAHTMYAGRSKTELMRQVNFGEGPVAKVFQTYTDAVFKLLEKEDKKFFDIRLKQSLWNETKVYAYNQGHRGEKLADVMAELWKNPPAEVMALALGDAEKATFRNENLAAKIISNAKRAALTNDSVYGKMAYALLETSAPFTKTPSNVAYAILQYTPAGLLDTLIQTLAGGGQRAFVKGIGRNITGTAVMGAGIALAAKGMLSGNLETDTGKRELDKAEHIPPRSVKIMDHWIPLDRLQPFGNLLTLGGAIYQSRQEKSGVYDTAMKVGTDFVTALSQMTFLKGVSGTLGAITDPEKNAEKYISQTVASFVPTEIANLAKSLDNRQIDTKNKMWATIKSRMPWMTGEGDVPKRDVFGHILKNSERESGLGRFAEKTFNAFPATNVVHNPVITEMRRIGATSIPPEATLTIPKEMAPGMTDSDRKKKLDPIDYDMELVIVGRAKENLFPQLMNSKEYKKADDYEKAKLFKALESKIEDSTRTIMLGMMAAERLPSQMK